MYTEAATSMSVYDFSLKTSAVFAQLILQKIQCRKAKTIRETIMRRLNLWKQGDFNELYKECLLPAIPGQENINNQIESICLSTKYNGLGLIKPDQIVKDEYAFLTLACDPLIDARAPPLDDNLANESEIMGQQKEVGGDYVSSKSGEIDPLIQENEVCKAEIAADQTNERHDVGESPNEIESFTVRRSWRNRRTPKYLDNYSLEG
ncbi:hypothetical protein GJ496_003938 [Pomphorhynchus laevis]|nr:hypothetical protein GJ496_003938 [Pomphorhynchus laevis]